MDWVDVDQEVDSVGEVSFQDKEAPTVRSLNDLHMKGVVGRLTLWNESRENADLIYPCR